MEEIEDFLSIKTPHLFYEKSYRGIVSKNSVKTRHNLQLFTNVENVKLKEALRIFESIHRNYKPLMPKGCTLYISNALEDDLRYQTYMCSSLKMIFSDFLSQCEPDDKNILNYWTEFKDEIQKIDSSLIQ